jgi:signal transduction histidine kinase/ActR/RegA family two-component response regulator
MIKLGLLFGDKQLESSYIHSRSPLVKRLLYVNFLFFITLKTMTACYLIAQIYMIATTIQAKGDLTFALLLFVPFVIGILALIKFSAHIEALSAFILIIGFLIGMLFEMNRLPQRSPETAFYLGYAYATIQRAVQTHLIHYQWVLFTGIPMLITRSGALGVGQIWIYIAHVFLDICVHYDSYKYEVIDRNMFSSIKKSEEQFMKFKDLLVALPVGIITVTKNLGKVLFTNEIFQREIGDKFDLSSAATFLSQFILRNEELNSMNRTSLNDEFTTTLREKLSSVINSEAQLHQQITVNVRTKNSPYRLYEVKIIAMSWDGEEALSIVFQDNTDQESLFQLKADHAHKDKVIDSISHELRTPLSSITGIIQIMEDSIQPQTELGLNLNKLKKNANLLNNIINCILDLQLIRANKIKMEASSFNLRSMLDELLEQFEFSAKSKKLDLRVDIKHDSLELYTDRNRLSQIIQSLVGNSLKFTQNGGVIIKVKNDVKDPRRIAFWVEDTGQGISKEDQEKLFGMYGTLSDTSSIDMRAGVGLGLTISKCLARELNGRKESLDLKQSALNVGTTFGFKILKRYEVEDTQPEEVLVNIPEENLNIEESFTEGNKSTSLILQASNSNQALNIVNNHILLDESNPTKTIIHGFLPLNQSPARNAMRNSRYLGKKESFISISNPQPVIKEKKIILGVDDNTFIWDILKKFLEPENYTVVTAEDGQAAVEVVRSLNSLGTPPDLVIMDIQMPKMDGYQATILLKELMKKNQLPNIPIIALSANDREDDKARSREIGMVMHLSKPFKKEQLLSAVKQYI